VIPRSSRAPALLATVAAWAVLSAGCGWVGPSTPAPEVVEVPLHPLAHQVEIRRTTFGVPQIHAETLEAAWFALAYVQLEDHGTGVITGMQTARGRMALVEGPSRIDADARNRQRHARAVEVFPLLDEDTRSIYRGFAEGMNHFIRLHRHTLPEWMEPDFTAQDVLARDVTWPAEGAMNAFRQRVLAAPDDPPVLELAGSPRVPSPPFLRAENLDPEHFDTKNLAPDHLDAEYSDPDPATSLALSGALADPALAGQEPQNVGSNAWALAPERTASGHAMLLRNPHLAWTAGYYEAHVRVPGKIDFYGDFRIGGPFTVIGGFNRDLGFATTNNQTRTHEFYAFHRDPQNPDHFLLDGVSTPIEREVVRVEFLQEGGSLGAETREFRTTRFGPVFHEDARYVYVYRPALDGEYRAGEQWLRMMTASSLDEWMDAMRMQARGTSHFTYADRDGNVLYIWISAAPRLPHPDGGDTLAIVASRSSEVWSELVPIDELPQLLNPPGGYVRNENDSPHYTNLNRILDPGFPFWVEEPRLRLRSQHSLEILHNDRIFTLEDVVEAKHSMRMLLADRVKDDLVQAVRASGPGGEIAEALELLIRWDNTVAAESRGALLFETWWGRYRELIGGNQVEPHAVPWSEDAPATTPYGLADPGRAAEAFHWAVPETAARFGSWDAAWGEVHRVRRGEVDVPVGGCGGALGCFRVLNFTTAEDGRRVANGGDGWVIAVEFGNEPRAYSVLAYGQSTNPDSPYHANQAELFAGNRMKPVLWGEAQIEASVIHRYRPGEEARERE
jgi:acyl-homoserine-lactone acylase